MSMMRFGLLFPELAARETRTIRVLDAQAGGGGLPVDEYGFDEWYCTERGCDCRCVMVNVLARYAQQHAATINHAFDKPGGDDLLREQTFLDPLNRQSPLASKLLDLFVNVVLADEQYRQRLLRHYRMFKNVVEDPSHAAHRLLRAPLGTGVEAEPRARRREPIPPPPPRSGKRKRWR